MPVSWKWFEQRVRHSRWLSDPVLVLLVLWGLFIVYGTMLPFDFSASSELIARRVKLIWQRPFKRGAWSDVTANVLLFIPWGFLLASWMARRGIGLIVSVAIALGTGAILSSVVELTQLFAPNRVCSFIDVVTNTFGATVGALIGWPWTRLAWPFCSIRLRQLIHSRPLLASALLACVAILVAGLAPFEFKPGVHDLRAALRAAQVTPFELPADTRLRLPKLLYWSAELLTWMLAGGLVALAAMESRARPARVICWAVAVAGLSSLAVETAQLAIPARDVDLTSVVLAVLGSTAAAIIVVRCRDKDPRLLIKPAIAIWALAVVLSHWNPPRFAWPRPPCFRNEWVVPFWSYFHSRTMADLADVIGQGLIFMPLGALLAARTHRQSFVGCLVLGLLWGAVLEIGQAFLPGRSADISDALSAGAGAVLGWSIWRWGEWT